MRMLRDSVRCFVIYHNFRQNFVNQFSLSSFVFSKSFYAQLFGCNRIKDFKVGFQTFFRFKSSFKSTFVATPSDSRPASRMNEKEKKINVFIASNANADQC